MKLTPLRAILFIGTVTSDLIYQRVLLGRQVGLWLNAVARFPHREESAIGVPRCTLNSEINLQLLRRQDSSRLYLVYRNELGWIDTCVA